MNVTKHYHKCVKRNKSVYILLKYKMCLRCNIHISRNIETWENFFSQKNQFPWQRNLIVDSE